MTFSIVIPVYNVAPYLHECLDSVCAAVEKVEKLKGFTVEELKGFKVEELKGFKVEELCGGVEVICVDDGSTDGSAEILDEYAVRFNSSTLKPFNHETLKPFNFSTFQPSNLSTLKPFNFSTFKVIHQTNRGVSAARNAALDVAQGDWLVFVDGDDVVRPDLLTCGRQAMLRHPKVGMVKFGIARFEDGETPAWTDKAADIRCVDMSQTAPEDVLEGGFTGRFYRREEVGSLRFGDLVFGEDELYKSQCVERTDSVAIDPTTLYAYRQRKDSAVHLPCSGQMLRDELRWRRSALALWSGSKKRLPRKVWRQYALWLTERFAATFFRCPMQVRKTGAWDAWIEAMADVSRCANFPIWNRMAARILRAFPCEFLAFVLFFCPHWLKTKGIHR